MANLAPNYAYGWAEKAYVQLETTYDTDTKPAATDAVGIVKSAFTPENPEIRSMEKIQSRQPPGFFKGLRSAKASLEMYLKTNGLGVENNFGPILQAALQNKVITGGTSVSYTSQDVNSVSSLRLHRVVGDGLGEAIYGATVDQLEFDIAQGTVPKLKASLAGCRMARARSCSVQAAALNATTVNVTTAGNGKMFERGSTVAFNKAGGTVEDNGGLGYLVTSDQADATTITPGLVSAIGSGDTMRAHGPTPTITGTAIAAVNNLVTLNGVNLAFVDAKETHKTGFGLRKEAQSDRPTGTLSGPGETIFDIKAYAFDGDNGPYTPSQLPTSGAPITVTAYSLTVRAGDAPANSHCKLVASGNVVAKIAAIEVPESAVAMVSIKAIAIGQFQVLFD